MNFYSHHRLFTEVATNGDKTNLAKKNPSKPEIFSAFSPQLGKANDKVDEWIQHDVIPRDFSLTISFQENLFSDQSMS